MADNWQLKAVISANAEGMLKALKNVNNMTKDTRKYLADVASSAGHLGGKLGLPFAALSGAIGGLSIMSIKSAVVGFTEMGEAVQKGALKAGMSVQEYQRMKYVFDQAGVGVEAMEGSMSKLNRTVGDAAAGKNANLAALMGHLGIKMRDANGQVRAGVDLLPQLADAFQKNENPAVRARMGMALFGKSYAEVLPLLAEGSAGVAENLKRFDRIKGVLGPEDIGAAKALGDSFKDLELVTKGFQGVVARQLIPVIKPMVDGLVDWWVANKKLVSVEVTKMAKDLADYIKTIDFKAVLQGVGDFFRSLSNLVDMVGGAKNALIGLVLFMNLQTILAFAGLIGSVGKLIWSLGVMAVTAIPGAIGALKGLGKEMGTAGSKANNLLGTLGKIGGVAGAAMAGWEFGSNVVNPMLDWASQKITGDKDASFGTALYGAFNDDPMAKMNAASKPSLIGSQQQKGRVDGQVNIKIDGLPPGSRVDQLGSGNMPINLDAGYRSLATGMPY